VRFNICIRIHASHFFVPVCAYAVRHGLRRTGQPSTHRPSFQPSLTCLLACDCGSRDHHCVQTVGTISGHFSSQTLLNKDRQCCELWRSRARCSGSVGCEWYDWQRPQMLCCSPHCDIADSCLTNDTLTTVSVSSRCYNNWRQLLPTVRRPSYDASSPFHQCRLPFRVPTRSLLATTVGDILMFYIKLQSPFFTIAPVCIFPRHCTEP